MPNEWDENRVGTLAAEGPSELDRLRAENARLREEKQADESAYAKLREIGNGHFDDKQRLKEENARLEKKCAGLTRQVERLLRWWRAEKEVAGPVRKALAIASMPENARLVEWNQKLSSTLEAQGICPGCPNGKMASQGAMQPGRSYPVWAGYVHHPGCTRPKG